MPSVAQEEPVVASSKKRRRGGHDDGGDDFHLQLYSAAAGLSHPAALARASSTPQHMHSSQHLFAALKSNDCTLYHHHAEHPSGAGAVLSGRKILPVAKRLRLDDERRGSPNAAAEIRGSSIHHHHHYHHNSPERTRPASPSLRQTRAFSSAAIAPTTANTTTTTTSATEAALQQTTANSRPAQVQRTATSTLLRPCHICHRRPTKKSDLDSFADCHMCCERTCYVCIRQCLGWKAGSGASGGDRLLGQLPTYSASFAMEDVDSENYQATTSADAQPIQPRLQDSWAAGGGGSDGGGDSSNHRQMVCSRCCVERGADGDVVCLGCLPFVDG